MRRHVSCGTKKLPRHNSGEEAFQTFLRIFKARTAVRNFRFHPTRKWELDFAWPALKVGIEIQGGIFRPGGGAHSRPANILRDLAKHNALLDLGWRVWEVLPRDCRSGAAVQNLLLQVPELLEGFIPCQAAEACPDSPAKSARRTPSTPPVNASIARPIAVVTRPPDRSPRR